MNTFCDHFSFFLKKLGLLFRLALFALLIPCLALTATAAERASLKLLTIGNSFTDFPLSCLPALAKAGGKTLVIGRANIGGCTLERHAQYLALAEANDPGGRVYKEFVDPKTGKPFVATLPEALAAEQWDIVTIHQASGGSYKPETFHPALEQLIAAVHKYAPQARIVLQETWAYREDHPAFQKDGLTQQKMYEGIKTTYHQLAADNGFQLIPSGDAMELARATPRWTFVPDKDFDYKNPPSGTVPHETGGLQQGLSLFKHKDGTSKLTLDGKHPNAAGQYLLACLVPDTLQYRHYPR